MMFMQTAQPRIVPGYGDPNSKICIIGEAPGVEEVRLLRPFVGSSGTVLDACLNAAGLTRHDCYLTTTIKERPKTDVEQYFNPRTGSFSPAGAEWVAALREELSSIRANVIVPLGSVSLAAVTGRKSITKYRGYVMQSLPSFGSRKVIGSINPAATIRGQYILRYYITADFRKAKAESNFPEIRRPERNIITPTTLTECVEWFEYLYKQSQYAVDIEVENFQVSAISFAPTPQTSVSFPFSHNYWTEEDEFVLWKWVHKMLTNKNALKIFQNGIFDIGFLWSECGIKTEPPYDDTMFAQSVMYPEMLKGLGFLGSLYCGSQEYWKDMVKFENIKEES